MNWVILLAIACSIAVAQGLFLGITMMATAGKTRHSGFFLGLALVGLAIRIGKSLVYYFWQDMSLWGVALGGAGLWLVGPALFIFLLYQKNEKIVLFQLLHFIPAFVLLFSGAFFGWSEMHLVYGFGIIQLFIYLIFCLYISSKDPSSQRNYLYTILAGVLLISGAFTYQIISDDITSYAIGGVISSVVLYLLNFVIFKGFKKTRKLKSNIVDENKSEILNEVLQDIQDIFHQKDYYKEPKLTLGKLAEKIDRPPYLVRQAIVQHLGTNFNDYVNKYRINEVKRMIDEDTNNYTIEGMAIDVGFSSTSSFYQAFKKYLKCTPVEYKKRVLT